MSPPPYPRLLPLLTLFVATLLWPAVARAQDEVVYYHTDAIGSVRMTTDATGAVLDRYDFLPFGEAWDPPTTPDARQFAGQVRDHETFAGSAATGLDYFGARYHQSAIGRFTTVDPVLDAETALTNPQRWNRYASALNRPLTHVDPDGRSPKAVVLALTVGHALYKGYDVDSTVADLVDAGGTLVSPESTGWERLLAVGTLAGELSGASDALRAGRGVLRAVDDVRDAGNRGARVLGAKAPDQVAPGVKNLEGQYVDDQGRVQPWRARYDAYGRQVERTDFTDLPDPRTHSNPHHHTREYGPGYGPKGKESRHSGPGPKTGVLK